MKRLYLSQLPSIITTDDKHTQYQFITNYIKGFLYARGYVSSDILIMKTPSKYIVTVQFIPIKMKLKSKPLLKSSRFFTFLRFSKYLQSIISRLISYPVTINLQQGRYTCLNPTLLTNWLTTQITYQGKRTKNEIHMLRKVVKYFKITQRKKQFRLLFPSSSNISFLIWLINKIYPIFRIQTLKHVESTRKDKIYKSNRYLRYKLKYMVYRINRKYKVRYYFNKLKRHIKFKNKWLRLLKINNILMKQKITTILEKNKLNAKYKSSVLKWLMLMKMFKTTLRRMNKIKGWRTKRKLIIMRKPKLVNDSLWVQPNGSWHYPMTVSDPDLRLFFKYHPYLRRVLANIYPRWQISDLIRLRVMLMETISYLKSLESLIGETGLTLELRGRVRKKDRASKLRATYGQIKNKRIISKSKEIKSCIPTKKGILGLRVLYT